MRALVLGSGAREHALGWALAGSGGARVWFAPGNAGTADLGTNLPDLDANDPARVAEVAASGRMDLVVVGPEEPLARGVVDELEAKGIPAFGPPLQAARLETSKAYAKSFMQRHGVPTASSRLFRDFGSFRRYVEGARTPLVVKKSGLAAGKGVLVSDEVPAIVEFGREVLGSDLLLVEECLEGFELSVFAVMDGRDYLLLPACADYKKAHDGDRGPNTGGMGAICPVPSVTDELWERVRAEAVEPTMRGLEAEGLLYRGVLFLGLMVTSDGCRVLEYNVRFGDPETQVLLPALEVDWAAIIQGAAAGGLGRAAVAPTRRACVGVVIASPGYPGSYPRELPVTMGEAGGGDTLLFHASTTRGPDGTLRTGGGRCFTVVGRAAELPQARDRAYAALGTVRFEGAWARSDIGLKYLG